MNFPSSAADRALTFGPFRFDPRNRLLYREEVEVVLPPRVLGVLESLLERPGAVVSKDMLLQQVWRDTNVSETSLTEAISLLRQALGDDPQRPSYVQTVHRRGYRFIAPIAVTTNGSNGSGAASPLGTAPWVESGATPAAVPAPAPGVPWRLVGSVVVVLIVALVLVAWVLGPRPSSPSERAATRFSIALEEGSSLRTHEPALALSPDGRELVYVQAAAAGPSILMRRALDSLAAKPIAGTEGATAPFFSFDGASVGFFADGKLKRVSLDGSLPATVCDAANAHAATWGPDGTIVFATKQAYGGLWKIGPDETKPSVLTVPDASTGEVIHTWPEFLPDGRSLLFTIWSNTFDTARVAHLTLDSGARRTIVEGGSYGRYLPAGFLLYAQSGTLMAAPFDPSRALISGRATAVLNGLHTYLFTGLAQFAVSRTGTLAYVPARGRPGSRQVETIRRDGTVTPVPLPSRFYRNVKVAPDGRRLALTILDGARSDVWVTDTDRRTLTRLTFEGFNIEPVWAPDGKRVAYASNHLGPYNIFVKPADGNGPAERILPSDHHQYPSSWSADGGRLALLAVDPQTGFDLHVLTFDGDRQTLVPFKTTAAEEMHGVFSPDADWIAYSSDESGRNEVYLEPYPARGARWQVSTEGGMVLGWSAAGDEILYESDEALMVARVNLGQDVRIERPRTVLKGDDVARAEPLPDGGVVTLVDRGHESTGHELHVVVDWLSELRELVPNGR